MKETVKSVLALLVLAYMVLFVLVNVNSGATALGAIIALSVGTIGGLVHVRRKYGKDVINAR